MQFLFDEIPRLRVEPKEIRWGKLLGDNLTDILDPEFREILEGYIQAAFVYQEAREGRKHPFVEIETLLREKLSEISVFESIDLSMYLHPDQLFDDSREKLDEECFEILKHLGRISPQYDLRICEKGNISYGDTDLLRETLERVFKEMPVAGTPQELANMIELQVKEIYGKKTDFHRRLVITSSKRMRVDNLEANQWLTEHPIPGMPMTVERLLLWYFLLQRRILEYQQIRKNYLEDTKENLLLQTRRLKDTGFEEYLTAPLEFHRDGRYVFFGVCCLNKLGSYIYQEIGRSQLYVKPVSMFSGKNSKRSTLRVEAMQTEGVRIFQGQYLGKRILSDAIFELKATPSQQSISRQRLRKALVKYFTPIFADYVFRELDPAEICREACSEPFLLPESIQTRVFKIQRIEE